MIDWILMIPGVKLESLNRDLRGTTVGARMAAAARSKKQRNLACLFCKSKFGTPPKPPLMVTMCRIGPRKLDSDNVQGALKHARDGIADWLGVDDGSPLLTWVYTQRSEGPKVYGMTIRVQSPPLTSTQQPARQRRIPTYSRV